MTIDWMLILYKNESLFRHYINLIDLILFYESHILFRILLLTQFLAASILARAVYRVKPILPAIPIAHNYEHV